MEIKILDVPELSEANIQAIAEWQAIEILKGKRCQVCQKDFPDTWDAVLTDKVDCELFFTHESCLTNKFN